MTAAAPVQAWILDTFCTAEFRGNPAAVVPLEDVFPDTPAMQDVARRLALPTTAFVIAADSKDNKLRWFTPQKELNLCGHATIATAGWLYGPGGAGPRQRLCFHTGFGPLYAWQASHGDIVLDLPRLGVEPCLPPAGLEAGLGAHIVRCARSVDDLLVELESAAAVAALRPDFRVLKGIDCRGHVVTAPSDRPDADFVSRSFFPALGVNEDQVCVSAHCKLAPYWGTRLGKERMTAVQLSERGGRLKLRLAGDRLYVIGTTALRGALPIPVPPAGDCATTAISFSCAR